MTANQFYVPLIASDAAQIVLQGEEHRHLARTARVRGGEEEPAGSWTEKEETEIRLAGATMMVHFWNE